MSARPPHTGAVADTTRVRSSLAPLQAEPRLAAEQVSQLLRGELVMLLAQDGDWFRVRCEDQYEGWLHRGYTFRAPGAKAEGEPRAFSLGAELTSANGGLALPFGALIFEGETLREGDVVDLPQMERVFPRDAARLVLTARSWFEGAPYEWGGKSPWGADCSGFVQSVFRAHGVLLPRDSSAQALIGEDSNSTPTDAAVGELLFFSDRADGRITHVGIALGKGAMVHVSLMRGGFAVEDFSDTSSDEVRDALRARFRLARVVI